MTIAKEHSISPKQIYTPDDYAPGLKSCWDGIWNCGRGIHSTTTAIVKDCVGGAVDGVIPTGGYVTEKSIVSGTTIGNHHAISISGRWSYATTCEVTFKMKYRISSNDNMYVKLGRYGCFFIGQYNNKLNSSMHARPFEVNVQPNVLHTLSFVPNVSERPVFLNGVKLSASNISKDNFTGEADNQLFLKNIYGELFCVRLYDHELSESEVITNYEIDKERFGL